MTKSRGAKKRKILVVEDHPLFRAMLVQLIERTHPDAAIIDLTLAGSSGLELIKDLTTRNFGLPVLVLTMHPERIYAERALHAGAKGFISKEASPAEVLTAIRTLLAGRIYVSRRVNETILQRQGHGGKPVPATGVDLLSDREIEVFQLIGGGLTSREIAGRLRLGPTTVDSYRAQIKEKLGIKNAAELYQRAAQWVAEGGH